jgi:hypothetical protein
MLKPA